MVYFPAAGFDESHAFQLCKASEEEGHSYSLILILVLDNRLKGRPQVKSIDQ